MKKFLIGVQPYTIREAMSVDYVGSIKKVAEIGYKGIELGPPPEGMTIAEQKSLLDGLGLKVVGTHAGFDTLDFEVDKIADYLEEINGEKFVTISMIFKSREDVLEKAEKMNKVGDQFRKRGITFLYHNHHWEFFKVDGEYVLDILLRETDPELVQTELDTYWIRRGGEDPVQYLRKLKNRAPLLHIKDMKAGGEEVSTGFGEGILDLKELFAQGVKEPFAEIGEGILDFKAIAGVAEEIGTKWLIVEQDESDRDPFESLKISYDNLVNLGLIES
ncbi:sugar phosphate isomerase/epimerase family protein [Lederbergia panacisoli]|uniref:sugar phosphate isomerase/epimerase family protein n=1 Tax=Lederbergia panacisoli TaxID=1255251 RepID=UPI00214C39E1|nr:sugar phosphate isomerase/epimerase [Lederbergia panacisoli]MCR2821023.1 sugar phosphate isomerase/epimerase [Lederbergia panacisoli]